MCLFLRYAVAGHRTALRYLLQHALWIIRPLTRLGFWRRLLDLLRCAPGGAPGGDTPEPTAVVIDSRSCNARRRVALRAASMACVKIHGVKIQMAVEKYGGPLAIDVAPAELA